MSQADGRRDLLVVRKEFPIPPGWRCIRQMAKAEEDKGS